MSSFSGSEALPLRPASRQSQLAHRATSSAQSFTPSVSTACLACRGKHLKCDGRRPCARCINVDSECVYIASRRGFRESSRSKTKNSKKRLALPPPREPSTIADSSAVATTTSVAPIPSFTIPAFNTESIFPNDGPIHPLNLQTFSHSNPSNLAIYPSFSHGADVFSLPFPLPHNSQLSTPRDQFMDSFYQYFHATHPFVLPKKHLLPLAKDCNIGPLLAAMRWIGSLYTHTGPTCLRLFEEAYRLIYERDSPQDGFIVQAMLLLIIGLDGSRRREKVHKILSDIEHTSVQIGLNTRSFALVNGRGMPMLEESWRRTWWDLYIVDATIAGVHRTTSFLLYEVPVDVALPCEENQFLSGHIPPPLYLEDMDNSGFFDGDREFSSFAYRIQCARNLGKFLMMPNYGPRDKNIAKIQTLLTNWQLHLPMSKRYEIYRDGQLDEMMFQAYMMAHAISILLHQPYSQLDTSPTRYINACVPNTPALSGDDFNSHTKQTIHAANEISKLITHRVPLLSHTHFFAYMVTLASTIHLSEWTLAFVPHNHDKLRQQIRLNIGALEGYSRIWPAASHLGGQIKGIAQEVYRIKREQQLQLTSQHWIGFTEQPALQWNLS